MPKLKRVYIGTSGWYYDHWEESFYHGIPAHERLPFYAEHFSTVEINSTFYHLPKEKSVENWATLTPKDFVFSVKASRYITHIKRLRNVGEGIEVFLKAIAPLKQKLGPILFLIPPFFKRNDARLKECLEELPEGPGYTFEFRHPSWHTEEIFALLNQYNAALCISDYEGKLSPIEVTADFVYVRLHGPKKAYQGSYDLRALKQWAKRIDDWSKQKLPVFIYFDNDEKGFAVKDAKRLIDARAS